MANSTPLRRPPIAKLVGAHNEPSAREDLAAKRKTFEQIQKLRDTIEAERGILPDIVGR